MTIQQNPITKQLTNQKSIDSTLISPTLGVNIKLVNTTEPTNYFVGTVTELIPSIKNADKAIYTSMKLDGTDNTGTKKTIILTVDQLENNEYTSGYDRMYYTSDLQNTAEPSVKEEYEDNIVIDDASVEVFDVDKAVIGKLIAYTKGDAEINGVISSIDAKKENLKIIAVVQNKINTVNLSLIDATSSDFHGNIIDIS